MKYIGILLFLLLQIAIMENKDETLLWGMSMNIVAYVSLAVVILGFFIDIWKSIKDNKSLSKEHDSLSKEHNSLGKEHNSIQENSNHNKELLSAEHARLIDSSAEIKISVNSIDKQLAVQEARREALEKTLTPEQLNIKSQIKSIYALNTQMENLQVENQELKRQISSLMQEKQQLQDQLLQYENTEDENMTPKFGL
ncbi:hypothetical protein [Caproicibacter fermentans]|uniref:Uncharacterized protein n=1 Tax=Caproicibacter fermentans TaxID=2576756 RepID=A0A7G8TD84_9FIRM|nr:hypothetical protein [Caproicibacter fermentans]QNK41575.1 hypothetical protein HCR03_04740 [Caproicibacter fermentans]